MPNDAAVVYIFLDDADKAVSMEDVKEWLQIINDVVEIKLQFDVATERPCYYVEFRSPVAAQQAVQYLNGARLKNCIVTIQSRVYSAAAATQGPASGSGESPSAAGGAPPVTRKRCRETSQLPFNHLLPPELQMDSPLAQYIPELEKSELYSSDGVVLWQKLQAAQKELVELYHDLEVTTAQVADCDAQLTQLLHMSWTAPASNDVIMSHSPSSGPGRKTALQAQHFLCHERAIAFDAHTPSRVVALLTDCFGPLSLCSDTVTQTGFFLVVRFVFAADEALFLAAAAASGSTEVTKQRDQRQGAEWRSVVQGLGWKPTASVAGVHHLFSVELDARLQRMVYDVLA
ncbi:conserved hypothetical protein [Leishmania major strain Friedlin]|uniref:RRM domain-containing protein n=1 Tax=Leishmania major TaxID=5664 RepID=Q4QE39_LEIMA|nr:conserved hypothetical protein [Leishmania major strain Friedlin]CAG9572386.1 RNA-binding_protein_27_-_putative [Leishmania major strain Friedlin]CAJ03413.1 conserved hypothetical protein [Leishmania major strain Friedlin]|eukprot:XP_001682409.1 conserved hypothetical protein [Leishmania major strain Friedlin]